MCVSVGAGGALLISGGDDQAIHVARLSLVWPSVGGALRVVAQGTLRLPNAHGSAVRVWSLPPLSHSRYCLVGMQCE